MKDTRLKRHWCPTCQEDFYSWHMDRARREYLYCVKCGTKVNIKESNDALPVVNYDAPTVAPGGPEPDLQTVPCSYGPSALQQALISPEVKQEMKESILAPSAFAQMVLSKTENERT